MNPQPLIDAINYRGVVAGLTHDFYRYPARFSPLVARAAIKGFTRIGDTVLDPFMGGSTSLVEALALGRRCVGTDISELALFLAGVKTSLVTDADLDVIDDWAIDVAPDLSPRNPVVRHVEWREAGYQRNLPWRFRKVAEQALNASADLDHALQPVARCIVLRTVQWAVDCKKHLPTAAAFRERMIEHTLTVTSGLRALREQVGQLPNGPAPVEFHKCAADEIASLKSELLKRHPPRLVVTSPPYPGVHVLYHRWQVLGRRETAAPYWIAECQDGQGASFYTFGDRRNPGHDEQYFDRLRSCYSEIRKVVRDDCIVVQLVGFARPKEQLPRYLDAMRSAGFDEFSFERAGRRTRREAFWRAVPNRKWYTWLREELKQTQEILLVHRAVP